jgi:ABC-2 type transport system ATP-binding protein
MAQKLGLATCLMSEKDLMVLDEPMSGLDPKARAYLKQHLLELKQGGKTVFFSTHMLADIEVLCDRIAILHDGSIRFSGTTEECTEMFQANDLEQAYLTCVGA